MNDSSEVKIHFLDYWRVVKVRWPIITIVFLLVVVSAGVTCYFLPREYYSRTIIDVKNDGNSLHIFTGQDGVQSNGQDPQLVSTQMQIIQSKQILYPVLENLKLIESWSPPGQRLTKEEAYYRLKGKMQVSEERATHLLDIGVFSTDPKEASNIANGIAVVYLEFRRDDQTNDRRKSLAALQEEVNTKQKDLEKAQREVQKIRTEEGIIDFNPESVETTQGTENTMVMDDQKEVNDAEIKVAELKTQLEQVDKLKIEELIPTLHSLNIDDPTVLKILPLYQDAIAEDARLLNSGLGENHPRVKALRAERDVYAKQLNEQIEALRSALGTKLKVAEATQAELQKKLDESKTDYNSQRKQSLNYINAKNQYINAKHILEQARTKLEAESMQEKMISYPAKIIENAEPSFSPAKPNVKIYMVAGVGVGLFLGIALAYFLEYLDTSVKTLDDVERFLGVPVLAVVPKGVSNLIGSTTDNADAEAYRILRTNMEFNRKNPNANTITLVSGGPGEGKSTTLNNLAVTCARGGYSVLVVDADLRRPSQHAIFKLDNSVGLSDYLLGQKEMADVICSTSEPNLSFMPSGRIPHDAVGILNSQRMMDLIGQVKSKYDLVFFDSPPILGVSDASVLASEVDITIMVVQYRRFPRDMLLRVKHAVTNVGGTLLGAVLNNVDTRHDSGYQYYTQYYDYYTPRKEDKPAKVAPARAGRPNRVHGDY